MHDADCAPTSAASAAYFGLGPTEFFGVSEPELLAVNGRFEYPTNANNASTQIRKPYRNIIETN